MDISYYEYGYIDDRYHNYIASANANMTAFDLVAMNFRVIHLMAALTYKIREETRIHKIREETRQRSITNETRQYQIKEG